ncbi:NEDD4-binding protein 1-like [Lineus longissimus]|uniref:NEDD4-binding protein 1-like n=1 Tax=Lineus longissimus TaxID=88925 RepID=UPI002B4F6628
MKMDEFIIDRCKVRTVDQVKPSVERRFGVKVVYNDVVKDEGMEKQWIAVSGEEQEKVTKAKEYLKTVSNAQEKVAMQFPEEMTEIISKASNYQKIEEQSGAVILFYKPGEIDILGTDIAVTLAMSAVEDLVSRYETEPSEISEMGVEDNEDVGVKQSETVSESRLDSQLKLFCEKHDLPYEDYCHTQSSVKRTLLSWLSNDMDNMKEEDVKLCDDVVCDGLDDSVVITGTARTNSDCVVILEPSKKTLVSKTSPSANLFGNENSLRVSSQAAANVSPVGEMTNVFQKAMSNVGRRKPDSPTVHSLRQFALSRGYSSEEVDEVLEENPDVRLSTILSALHHNRIRREEQKPQPMDVELPSASGGNRIQTKSTVRDSSPKPGTSASTSSSAQSFCSAQSSSSNSKLEGHTEVSADSETTTFTGHGNTCNEKEQNRPGSWSVNEDYDDSVFKYFKQLSKHFTEETSDLSREDLLKNNAERQKILKDAYEKAKEESSKGQSQGTGQIEKEGKTDQQLTKQQKRKKKRKRRKKKAVEAVGTATQGAAASAAEKEEDDMDESSEEGEAEEEDEDTRDVVVEEEVQFVAMKGHAKNAGGYSRSPRPQSPQNPKKARQENRTGKRLDVEGPVVSKTAGVMQQAKKFSVNDWTLNNSQQKFDDATASGSGCGNVRPRHPSGNTQSKQKNSNFKTTRQPYSRPQQQPSYEQYRSVPPAAGFGMGGQQSGRRVANRPSPKRGHRLRPIVIDGSNVAVAHGNQNIFSCRGIEIAINYFIKRGHKDVTAFVPRWRQGGQNHQIRPTVDREILNELEKEGRVAFTPSRYINGRKITSYDDRFVVELAAENDGVILSNDNFRDLMHVKPKWTTVIQERLLMFTFAGDHFMVPDDPMGPRGPSLDQLLQKPADPMDYGFNRTDGAPGPAPNFLQMPPQIPFQPMQATNPRLTAAVNPMQQPNGRGQPRLKHAQQPMGQPRQQHPPHKQHPPRQRAPESLAHPPRPQQETENLSSQLLSIFPDKSQMVNQILINHASETDLNKLSAYILDAMI